jgi:hypothetical protein
VLSNSGFLRLREPKPDDPPDTDPPRIENKTVGRHDRRSNAAFALNQPQQLMATSDRIVSKQRVLFFLWYSNGWTEVDLASSAVAQMGHSLNQCIPAPHVPFSLPLEHVLFSRSRPGTRPGALFPSVSTSSLLNALQQRGSVNSSSYSNFLNPVLIVMVSIQITTVYRSEFQ